MQIRPDQLSHQKESVKLCVEDDDNIQNPMSSVEHTEESLIEDENDQNYLAFSDTDTVECYTVPSPIYPSLPHKHGQHRILKFYDPSGERVR